MIQDTSTCLYGTPKCIAALLVGGTYTVWHTSFQSGIHWTHWASGLSHKFFISLFRHFFPPFSLCFATCATMVCVCSNTCMIVYGVCTCMCFCASAHSCVQRQKRKSSLPPYYFLPWSLETGSLNGRVPVWPAQGCVLNHYFYIEGGGQEEAKVAGSQQALVRSSCTLSIFTGLLFLPTAHRAQVKCTYAKAYFVSSRRIEVWTRVLMLVHMSSFVPWAISPALHIYTYTHTYLHIMYMSPLNFVPTFTNIFLSYWFMLWNIFFSLNSLDKELEFQHGHFLCLLNYRT